MRTSSPPPTDQTVTGTLETFLPFAAATFMVAWLGSTATMRSVESEWFASLDKPGFYPPDSLFGIVWTVLYVLIAVAGWLAWRNGGGLRTLVPWTVQLLLNLGWTVFFFGIRQPGWALVVIVALLVVVVWTAAVMWPYSRNATWMFVPYALWVAFAGVLNVAIVFLSRGS